MIMMDDYTKIVTYFCTFHYILLQNYLCFDFQSNIQNNYAIRCDASLAVLNSNMQANFFVTFKDLFPVSLNALEFNATIDGTEYATASVEFRYAVYNIEDVNGVVRTQLE